MTAMADTNNNPIPDIVMGGEQQGFYDPDAVTPAPAAEAAKTVSNEGDPNKPAPDASSKPTEGAAQAQAQAQPANSEDAVFKAVYEEYMRMSPEERALVVEVIQGKANANGSNVQNDVVPSSWVSDISPDAAVSTEALEAWEKKVEGGMSDEVRLVLKSVIHDNTQKNEAIKTLAAQLAEVRAMLVPMATQNAMSTTTQRLVAEGYSDVTPEKLATIQKLGVQDPYTAYKQLYPKPAPGSAQAKQVPPGMEDTVTKTPVIDLDKVDMSASEIFEARANGATFIGDLARLLPKTQ